MIIILSIILIVGLLSLRHDVEDLGVKGNTLRSIEQANSPYYQAIVAEHQIEERMKWIAS